MRERMESSIMDAVRVLALYSLLISLFAMNHNSCSGVDFEDIDDEYKYV